MKYLRLVQSGYENYTGPIGSYEFVDGVSVDMIPRNDRDRLATAFQFVEFESEDDEPIPAGVAYRLIAMSGVRASDPEPLERQTVEEKVEEIAKAADMAEPTRTIYERKALEAIADKRGIGGLREIGDVWGVKSRQILALIDMILSKQSEWQRAQEEKRAERRENETAFEVSLNEAVKAEVPIPAPEQVKETDTGASGVSSETTTAAMTGDMSASLNGE